jgi:LysR family transcriptional regulator, flagellar master operon regulator
MPVMDIKVFNTFLEVAKVKHFGKAAENLYITQAAVSARIKNLEEFYNTTLFIRDKSNIRLTLAGEKLQEYALIIVEQLKQSKANLSLLDSSQVFINIAATANIWDSLLVNHITALVKAVAEVSLGAEISVHESIHRRLLDKTLDVGMLLDPIKEDEFVNQVIGSLTLVLVSSTMDTALSSTLPYILVDWGKTFNKEQRVAHKFNPVLKTSSAKIALDILLDSGGCAYLPMSLVAPYLAKQKLTILDSTLNMPRKVYFTYHKHNIFLAQLANIASTIQHQSK